MKLFTRQYVLLPLILAATGSLAQTQQVKFNLVTGTNGVSLGKINGMTRDKFGFMWFSGETNRCIIRFDGSHMTRYMNDPRNPNSLGGYYPECLSADEEGNIWVGFYGQGVDKFDQITNTFSHYRHKKDDPESLGSDTVSAILVDHLGNVWVGNDSGLDLLDKNTGKFKHFRNKAGDPSSLSHNMVRSLYEDRNGELWVGTGFAFSPQEKGGGLNRFNRSSGTFTRYLHDPKNPHSLIDNKVRSIFEDSYGTLWIGTNGDGLHTMDKKTGVITRHRYNPSKPDQLSRPAVKNEIDHITFITEDADRKIWIGTLLNGLTRFDPSSNKIDRFANDTDKTGALNDNSCWWANSTPDGFVWMSTQNSNLFKIDIYHSVIPHVGDKRADGLRAFAEGSDSICWYGTLEGLIRKNLKTGSTRKFVHELANENSLSNDHVRCIMPDKNGDLWIGTDDGFNHFNFKTETFTRYYHNPSASLNLFNGVTSLYQDHDSSIWAGSVGSGLAKLDPRTGKLIIFNGADSNSISRHSITALQGGNKNDLWIGTYNQGGLNKLSMENGKVTYYLPGSNIYSLFRDAAGIFWVGTDEALFRYDEKTDSFNSIAETNSGNNIVEVSSIVSDDEDNLWVGTRTSIYRLNKARDQVTRYGNEYGIPDANNFFYVSFKRHDGQLIFGDDFGYYTFYPKELKRTSSKTQLYFTRFWLNDKEVIPTKKGPLKESLFFEKKIDLLYNQNVFSFSSTFVDFRNDGEKKIYYKLENYDADWHSAEAEQQVQYFKVPAGNYMLRIKTANTSDGEWVNRSMAITISPPWWATWWAYIVYSLLFIAAVYSVHRLQRSRVIRAERERTRARELEQAKEIEKAYVLIKCKADLETYVLDHLGRISGVKKVEYTAGAGCILVGIVAYTAKGLYETLVSKIQKIPQIYSTTTLICGHTCIEEGESYE